MLRLGILDGGTALAADDLSGHVSPAVVAQALGSLVADRQPCGTPTLGVERLCAAVLSERPGEGITLVKRLLDCGVGIDALYEHYIPRAAARLGELWVDDVLSFTAVTVGTARLTEIFRQISPVFMRARRQPARHSHRALFALVPGEAHALGIVLAADTFQRAGWTVQVELQADEDTLVDMARQQPFRAIGLSAGSRRMQPALEGLVARLQGAAQLGTRFIVGGAIVGLAPDLGQRLDVTLASGPAQQTVYEMEQAA